MNCRVPLRLAIVGCGAIADQMHIPAALAVNEVRLVGVVDADEDRARNTAVKYGILNHGTEISDIQSHADAVLLCTPPHVRPTIAEQAFAAGLHVMCEKPFACTVAECERIIRAGRRAGMQLAVAHIFRFWPSRRAVKAIIDSAELGSVRSVTATQGNPYSWNSVTGYNMRPGMVPGGVLFDAGIHPLDTLLWWFGRPEIVSYEDDSLGGLESNVRLTMSFENVPEVKFRQSRTASMTNEFRITTEQATIVLSNYSPNEIRIIRNGMTELRRVTNQPADHNSAEQEQLRDFASAIVDGREPFVTGAMALEVLDLIERCYHRRGSRHLPKRAPSPGSTI